MSAPIDALPAIARDADGPVFAEPWQAQAFAITLQLHENGAFAWPDWAARLAARIAAHPQEDYWESWLAALEAMLAERGIAA